MTPGSSTAECGTWGYVLETGVDSAFQSLSTHAASRISSLGPRSGSGFLWETMLQTIALEFSQEKGQQFNVTKRKDIYRKHARHQGQTRSL